MLTGDELMSRNVTIMNRKKREKQILDASVRVFARQGYMKTAVSEIIKEADVARGTFYLYFTSRKDIYNTLIDRFISDVSQATIKINETHQREHLDIRQKSKVLANDLVAVLTQNKELTKIVVFNSFGLDPDFDTKLNAFFERAVFLMKQSFEDQIKMHNFRGGVDSEILARSLFGSLKDLLHWALEKEGTDLKMIIERVIDIYLDGVLPDNQINQAAVA